MQKRNDDPFMKPGTKHMAPRPKPLGTQTFDMFGEGAEGTPLKKRVPPPAEAELPGSAVQESTSDGDTPCEDA